jgi:branched-chain amino acid transport system permease protein
MTDDDRPDDRADDDRPDGRAGESGESRASERGRSQAEAGETSQGEPTLRPDGEGGVATSADGVGGLLREALLGRDAGLVLGVVGVITVAYVLVAWALGLGVSGTVGTVRQVLFFGAVYALVTLALNLHWGYAGVFNIGVAGFMAVAVYVGAIVARPTSPPLDTASTPPGLGLPLPVGILAGVLAAALVGGLVALPALRLRADYLAIVTVAFSEIVRLVVNAQPLQEFTVAGLTIGTGAASGLSMPTNPVVALYYRDPALRTEPTGVGRAVFPVAGDLGVEASVVVNATYLVVLGVALAAFYWLLRRVGNSPFGRVLKAIREDETVARALGKDTRRFKVVAFMVGCGLMGLAGILWQGSQSPTSPNSYRPILTFYVWVALILGGAGSNTGSVVGGFVFAAVLFQGPTYVRRLVDSVFELGATPDDFVAAVTPLASLDPGPLVTYALGELSALRFVLLGVVLVALMQRRPQGLLGHRKEVASSIDLSRRPSGSDRPAAADGGGDR